MLSVVCLVLVDPAGAVLATRRSEHKSLGGLWEFPGGKLESGELPETALRREILEELRLELGALEPLRPVVHAYPFGTIRLLPFRAYCRERPELTLTEHTAARWVAPHETDRLAWAPADLPVLKQLVSTEKVKIKKDD